MYLPPELAVCGVLAALFAGALSCGRKLAAAVILTISWVIWITALAPFEHWYNAIGGLALDSAVVLAVLFAVGVGSLWRAILIGLLCAQVFCHLGYIILALSPITEREFGRAFFAYMHVLDGLFIAQLCCIIIPGVRDVLGSVFRKPRRFRLCGLGRRLGNCTPNKGAQSR